MVLNTPKLIKIKTIPFFKVSDDVLNIRKSLLLFSFIGIILSIYNLQLLDISVGGLKVKGITFEMLKTILVCVITFKFFSFIFNLFNEYNAWKLDIPEAINQQLDDYFKTMLPEISERSEKLQLSNFPHSYAQECISITSQVIRERLVKGEFIENTKTSVNKSSNSNSSVMFSEEQLSDLTEKLSNEFISNGVNKIKVELKNDMQAIDAYRRGYKNCKSFDVIKVMLWDVVVPLSLALYAAFSLVSIEALNSPSECPIGIFA
jgi:hypothetical protein